MKVGDLVKYHRAGKCPAVGVVYDIDDRVDAYGYPVDYYCVHFSDSTDMLSEDRLEVINESR